MKLFNDCTSQKKTSSFRIRIKKIALQGMEREKSNSRFDEPVFREKSLGNGVAEDGESIPHPSVRRDQNRRSVIPPFPSLLP